MSRHSKLKSGYSTPNGQGSYYLNFLWFGKSKLKFILFFKLKTNKFKTIIHQLVSNKININNIIKIKVSKNRKKITYSV